MLDAQQEARFNRVGGRRGFRQDLLKRGVNAAAHAVENLGFWVRQSLSLYIRGTESPRLNRYPT